MDSDAPPVLATPESPPTKRKSRTALYVILGLFLSIGSVVVLIVGGGAFFLLTATDVPGTTADREAVLGITDVALWIDDFSPDTSKESLKKTKYIDKSYDIEYECDDSLNDMFRWGDISEFSLLKASGLSFGNVFVGRHRQAGFYDHGLGRLFR